MIDLALHRSRVATAATDTDARRALGAALLASLDSLADRAQELLPELGALRRVRAPRRAVTLYVGWAEARGGSLGPRFALALEASSLVVRWGYGREGPRGRWVSEGSRRRRRLGDALIDQLGVLRAGGVALYLREDGVAVSEQEWAQASGGSAALAWHLDELPLGEVLARRVAEAVARLASLARSLGAFGPSVAGPSSPADRATLTRGVRALRWEERAQGVGAAPSGIVPFGDAFAYDPVTGWFAPERFAAHRPPSLAALRLAPPVGSPAAPVAPRASFEGELTGRLARWLAARGVRDGALAGRAEIFVASERVPRGDEAPPLEALLSACLGDPSGDVAVALAGLLQMSPQPGTDWTEPVTVAREVPLRLAASAARGVERLREHGALRRGDEGARACFTDAAIRPVVALAVERALGGLDPFPEGAPVRAERRLARPWELAGITRSANLEGVAHRFVRFAQARGLVVELDIARAMIVGLRTKPFAVLSGLSGTGKTRVALTLARFFTDSIPSGAARVAVVPVRPDWIDSRGLLGWLNALQGAWEDTEALRVILHASEEPSEPHFVILDEMNLARVEHYLAEVLSAIESGAPIPLHGRGDAIPSADGARRVPPSVRVPPNVFVLGTVNVDESTHALSPKVIDRAWTWEFAPVAPSAMARAWLRERRSVGPATTDERAALLDPSAADDPVRSMVLAMGRDGVGARVDALYECLAAHGRPFGFRVVAEVLRFVQLCEREGVDTPPSWWLDHAVLGKVLPALGGAPGEMEPLLRALRPLLEGVAAAAAAGAGGVGEERSPRAQDPLARSAEKVREMLRRAEQRGYVTFSR